MFLGPSRLFCCTLLRLPSTLWALISHEKWSYTVGTGVQMDRDVEFWKTVFAKSVFSIYPGLQITSLDLDSSFWWGLFSKPRNLVLRFRSLRVDPEMLQETRYNDQDLQLIIDKWEPSLTSDWTVESWPVLSGESLSPKNFIEGQRSNWADVSHKLGPYKGEIWWQPGPCHCPTLLQVARGFCTSHCGLSYLWTLQPTLSHCAKSASNPAWQKLYVHQRWLCRDINGPQGRIGGPRQILNRLSHWCPRTHVLTFVSTGQENCPSALLWECMSWDPPKLIILMC